MMANMLRDETSRRAKSSPQQTDGFANQPVFTGVGEHIASIFSTAEISPSDAVATSRVRVRWSRNIKIASSSSRAMVSGHQESPAA